MKAIKKPIPIEVILLEDLLKQKREDIEIKRGGPIDYQIYNRKHQSWIGCELHDYINVTDINDTYPIAKDVFEATYQIIHEENQIA